MAKRASKRPARRPGKAARASAEPKRKAAPTRPEPKRNAAASRPEPKRNATASRPEPKRNAAPSRPEPKRPPTPSRVQPKRGSASPPSEPAPSAAPAWAETERSSDAIHEPTVGPSFPVVGIGASAGGLEALQQFFANVPDGNNMAYVVVQHLDPNDQGMLVELLARDCRMPVTQATDHLQMEPEHVYVIPPNKDMSVLHGNLHLLPQTSPRGLSLPIDFFFRALADDMKERSIGVILSGMGSDGTLGLRAIKENAGATFVQALGSAKFDGMPRSAIDSGLADVVAPVEELPGRILAYRKHRPQMLLPTHLAHEDKTTGALDKVFVLLRAQTGNDFSLYKKSTIIRRIERRMSLHQIDNIDHYVRYLRENPREIELLFKELLIGVTCFFRDPAVWEHLKKEVMPALISLRSAGGMLRAWVPGCSTGEEAYSLAMIFKEAMEPFKPVKNITLQIFATDVDQDAIEKARQGLYPDNIAADVSPERLRRYFVQEDRGYRVSKDIREMVVFAPQNLIMDPPFTKLDILSCRNLLIYLSATLQKKLIPLFYYSLNPGGVLLLGSAETIGAFTALFTPLEGKNRIYRRLEHSMMTTPVEFPSVSPTIQPSTEGETEAEPPVHVKPTPQNLQALADRMLVQRFSPVGILCNEKGDILYISARAGKYLEPAVGKANLNILAMAREGLRYEMSSAFATALREQRAVTTRGLRVGTNGGTQILDLTVQKLTEPKELRGTVLVVMTDVEAPPPLKKDRSKRVTEPARIAEMEQELQRSREEVQTTREEMQTSQEELKSTNEELQSTNEELQSTNEQLTTSKEEMQSLNEELQTVNHELQAKVDELSRSNNDMKNLLNSTDIATLFLDGELNVRRFTTPTAKIIKLIPGDAGRPITDITSDLEYPDLAEDAREVLRTLVFKEKQVATRHGRWFSVRIMPYRTLENVIDGVVITFTDASAARALESTLREQASQLKQMADALPNLVWSCRPDGACDFLSRQWADYTGIPDSEQLGYRWLEQVHPEDRDRVRDAWRDAVKTGRVFDVELRIRNAGGDHRWFKARSVPIRSGDGTLVRWYGTYTDIDELKRAPTMRHHVEAMGPLVDKLADGVLMLERNSTIRFVNSTAERLLGRRRGDVVGRSWKEALPELAGSPLDAALTRALADGASVTVETHLPAGNGAYRVELSPLSNANGPDGLTVLLLEGHR